MYVHLLDPAKYTVIPLGGAHKLIPLRLMKASSGCHDTSLPSRKHPEKRIETISEILVHVIVKMDFYLF